MAPAVGLVLKIYGVYFVEQPAAVLPAKKRSKIIEQISKEMEKNTKSGLCLKISFATIFQPRIPAHLI